MAWTMKSLRPVCAELRPAPSDRPSVLVVGGVLRHREPVELRAPAGCPSETSRSNSESTTFGSTAITSVTLPLIFDRSRSGRRTPGSTPGHLRERRPRATAGSVPRTEAFGRDDVVGLHRLVDRRLAPTRCADAPKTVISTTSATPIISAAAVDGRAPRVPLRVLLREQAGDALDPPDRPAERPR